MQSISVEETILLHQGCHQPGEYVDQLEGPHQIGCKGVFRVYQEVRPCKIDFPKSRFVFQLIIIFSRNDNK